MKHIANFKEKKRPRRRPFYASHAQQVKALNCMYLNHQNLDIADINSELLSKLNGYKQQDLRRTLYTPEEFITMDALVEKLVAAKLRCFYCDTHVHILYATVREPTQWSLDRIDNEQGHSATNTVISCLQCNLRRRRTSHKHFVFTSNLTVFKKSYSP
jgi:hypothetical protein